MNTTAPTGEHCMRDMIRRQRVDVLELRYAKAGATFEKARRVCGQCNSVDACLVWLASDNAGQAPDFCPNKRLFERFRAI